MQTIENSIVAANVAFHAQGASNGIGNNRPKPGPSSSVPRTKKRSCPDGGEICR